jgi:AraC-like DNA-binding protein
MSSEGTVLSTTARMIIDEAARLELDTDALCRAVDIDPAALRERDGRVLWRQELALWEAFERVSGTDAGLRLVKTAGASSFGVLGYLAMTSATVRDSLAATIRYHRLVKDVGNCRLDERAGLLTYVRTPAPGAPRSYLDFHVGVTAVLPRRWAGANGAARRVGLMLPRPRSTASYEDILGCPVVFDQESNFIEYDADGARAPMPSAQPELAEYFEALAREHQQRRPGSMFQRALSEALQAALLAGDPRLSEVARRLGTSARTLQRRLTEHELSFQAILDDLRKREALRLLQAEDLSVDQISDRLGYADTKSFRRAFRRWTGTAPSTARRGAPLAPMTFAALSAPPAPPARQGVTPDSAADLRHRLSPGGPRTAPARPYARAGTASGAVRVARTARTARTG